MCSYLVANMYPFPCNETLLYFVVLFPLLFQASEFLVSNLRFAYQSGNIDRLHVFYTWLGRFLGGFVATFY